MAVPRQPKHRSDPADPGGVTGPGGNDGVTVHCEIRGATTVLAMHGSLDDTACPTLRDVMDLARSVRRHGPIVIDLNRIDRLSMPAAMALVRAVDDARPTGRAVTLGPVPAAALSDPRTARFVEAWWPQPAPVAAGRRGHR